MSNSTTIRIASALCCAALAAALTGCAVDGSPVAAEPDVRKLETGTYAVDRHRYTDTAGEAGALVEGTRMSAAVVPAVKIDPSLSHGRGGTVVPDVAGALDFVAHVSKPVLENRKFVTGYAALGSDQADPAGENRPAADATAVTTAVFRFPDATAATLAARELEDVDLAVSPENRKLASTKYPEAYVHWRPNVPTIGAFLAHEQFVISLFIQRPRADSADLTAWVDKTLAAELTQLRTFAPTPVEKLDDLPVDPEGLLARAVVADRAEMEPNQHAFAVYSPSHLVNNADDQTARQRLIESSGAESIALVDGGSVTRVRDLAGAQALMTGLIDSAGHYDALPAPTDIPGAKCLRLNSKGDKDEEYKYRCYVPYKRYLGIVSSDQEPEVRQKISAQYALLANSL
ncbi:hypothetical protein FEK33_19735 [Nocardia asteroides NBRC 15531]|uniref:Uncharacterized protein n=1 Tax=Nocardia asteroides NBRC 15531 TaxID=1110697 RepID=U5EJV3_NOCAS|nr:hypothetical protein [Nocardia asteroides]TLF65538.1 hypothetical protein FEK33_19735 [Nocardia asteroides NBRC 15531]UGT47702.1 hypothetical protein LT345_24890 [Nocardia asteroides]SFM52983.1 hypothetical protein SAMN05444423_103280 [Nocardia asteroides]VEG33378.1 Uncharacterised protein [Nocardia asteroides]GAD87555.1 hypothetical protein NCAST_35_00770 [Nocardia asteroides NBRC 15531]